MTDAPKPNQIYRHFKGNLYRIVTLATHSETGETLVVYQALYGDYRVYARELSQFMSLVDRTKYPNAEQEERFRLLPQIVGQQECGPAQGAAERETVPARDETERDSAKEDAGAQDSKERAVSAVDPLVLQFLDAGTYRDRLNLLAAMHARITDDMINTMAISLDVEIGDGELEERYGELKACLLTRERYECDRLRLR